MENKIDKSRREYSVPGVSGEGMIGHASKVHPISTNYAQKDLSKIQWTKKSMRGYDPKAYEYKC